MAGDSQRPPTDHCAIPRPGPPSYSHGVRVHARLLHEISDDAGSLDPSSAPFARKKFVGRFGVVGLRGLRHRKRRLRVRILLDLRGARRDQEQSQRACERIGDSFHDRAPSQSTCRCDCDAQLRAQIGISHDREGTSPQLRSRQVALARGQHVCRIGNRPGAVDRTGHGAITSRWRSSTRAQQ